MKNIDILIITRIICDIIYIMANDYVFKLNYNNKKQKRNILFTYYYNIKSSHLLKSMGIIMIYQKTSKDIFTDQKNINSQ